MGYHTKPERPRMLRIQHVVKESDIVRTIIFQDEACRKAVPGQFVMIWVPGYGEMPMSLSQIDANGYSSITVRPIGVASTRICTMHPGEYIGIRGPYGKGFNLLSGPLLLVGGGIGVAPLIPLSELLANQGANLNLVIAGKSSIDLLFVNKARHLLPQPKHRIVLVTEAGDEGFKGQATDVVSPILRKKKIEGIYTCGPERMMAKLFALAEERGIPLQASIERNMECAIGICGACCIDKYLVCRDGPVFSSNQIRQLGEFGAQKRDRSGRAVEIQA